MKSKQDTDLTDAIVSGLLKAAMSNTEAMKQNSEDAAVTNSSMEAKRLPITLKFYIEASKEWIFVTGSGHAWNNRGNKDCECVAAR